MCHVVCDGVCDDGVSGCMYGCVLGCVGNGVCVLCCVMLQSQALGNIGSTGAADVCQTMPSIHNQDHSLTFFSNLIFTLQITCLKIFTFHIAA